MSAVNETTAEKVTRIMETSKNGVVMRAFIMCALQNYAKEVSQADLSEMQSFFISPEAWKSCAAEVLEEIHEY